MSVPRAPCPVIVTATAQLTSINQTEPMPMPPTTKHATQSVAINAAILWAVCNIVLTVWFPHLDPQVKVSVEILVNAFGMALVIWGRTRARTLISWWEEQ